MGWRLPSTLIFSKPVASCWIRCRSSIPTAWSASSCSSRTSRRSGRSTGTADERMATCSSYPRSSTAGMTSRWLTWAALSRCMTCSRPRPRAAWRTGWSFPRTTMCCAARTPSTCSMRAVQSASPSAPTSSRACATWRGRCPKLMSSSASARSFPGLKRNRLQVTGCRLQVPSPNSQLSTLNLQLIYWKSAWKNCPQATWSTRLPSSRAVSRGCSMSCDWDTATSGCSAPRDAWQCWWTRLRRSSRTWRRRSRARRQNAPSTRPARRRLRRLVSRGKMAWPWKSCRSVRKAAAVTCSQSCGVRANLRLMCCLPRFRAWWPASSSARQCGGMRATSRSHVPFAGSYRCGARRSCPSRTRVSLPAARRAALALRARPSSPLPVRTRICPSWPSTRWWSTGRPAGRRSRPRLRSRRHRSVARSPMTRRCWTK